MGETDKKTFWEGILQFFTAHPLFGLFSFLGTLAGLVVFFFPSIVEPKRELVYAINPVRTPILRVANKADFSIAYKGVPINDNVTAVQIALWNVGRQPIHDADVLSPIQIVLHNQSPRELRTSPAVTNRDAQGNVSVSFTNTRVFVIEASIQKVTRDVCRVTLSNSSAIEAGTNFDIKLGVNWRVLEKDDGALIQVVYIGDPETSISVEGTIEGQRKLGQKIPSAKFPPFYFTIVYLALITALIDMKTTFSRASGWLKWFNITLLGCMIIGVIAVTVWALWDLHGRSVSPFGF